MVASAFALTVLGLAFELLHHRVGVMFVVIATSMLAAFGLAAYGASAIVGAALEPRGVARAVVRVDTQQGPVRIGPASLETARAIVTAVAASRC
jgi:hypothetical protein